MTGLLIRNEAITESSSDRMPHTRSQVVWIVETRSLAAPGTDFIARILLMQLADAAGIAGRRNAKQGVAPRGEPAIEYRSQPGERP